MKIRHSICNICLKSVLFETRQGEDIELEDVKKIMSQIERDGGVVDDETPETLNFQEFCQIMKNVEGGSTAELVAAFAQKAQVDALMDQVNEPIWMKWKREMEEAARDGGVKFNTAKNARMKLAEVLDGNTTQLVVMVLILLDVVAVILEIVVHELYCPCDPYYLKDSTATAKKWKLRADSQEAHSSGFVKQTFGYCDHPYNRFRTL